VIRDKETNFVYLADTLQKTYPEFATEFIQKLKDSGIDYGFLPNTKDTWAVDYMPIQISEKRFIQFTYKPDYLISTKKWAKTISDVDFICKQIGIDTVKSEIIIDGGNISKWSDRILMTSKVFEENKQIPEKELINRLKDLFEVNILNFVPVEKGDWLGHADGMARFIDFDTVLINDYSNEDLSRYIDFLTALHNSKIDWIKFPFNPYQNENEDDATGLYLNYLETEKNIFLPVFGLGSDRKAIETSKRIFPDKKIIPIQSNEPARDNGIINCLTWNIKK